MRKTTAMRIALFVALLATAAACKLSSDQQAAVDMCKTYGNASRECGMANRMLASGSPGIKKALEQERQAATTADQQAAAAQALEAELAAKGVDACDQLRQELVTRHPNPACAGKMDTVMDYLREDPGCAGWLKDLEGANDEALNFLEDCDG
jgi:hypothetical protein